jgi:uncharacterized protein (DUF58 family)
MPSALSGNQRPIRRLYRVPPAGWVYITVSALLGVGAINSQNNLLFLIFGLALGAILVSGVVSGSIMMGIRLDRLPTSPTRVNERTRIGYRVRNTNRVVPVFAVSVTEEALVPTRSRGLMPSPEPNPRFWGLFAMRLPPKVPRPHAFVSHVSPKAEREAWTVFEPKRRGPLRLRRIRVSTTFPLGIVEKIVVFEQAAEVLIEPEVRPISRSALDALVAQGRFADTSSPRKGMGLEFFGLREYAPGDSMRHLHWRASARVGTLLTRETSAPSDETFVIELQLTMHELRGDVGDDPLLPDDRPGERALTLAASLAASGLRRHMRVGLRCEALALDLPPDAGARHLTRVLRTLALLGSDDDDIETAGPGPASTRNGRQTTAAAVLTVAATPKPGGRGAQLTASDLDRLAPPPQVADGVPAAIRGNTANGAAPDDSEDQPALASWQGSADVPDAGRAREGAGAEVSA